MFDQVGRFALIDVGRIEIRFEPEWVGSVGSVVDDFLAFRVPQPVQIGLLRVDLLDEVVPQRELLSETADFEHACLLIDRFSRILSLLPREAAFIGWLLILKLILNNFAVAAVHINQQR